MKVYAFDVDHTLDVSEGPIPAWWLKELHEEGHIVGICGNWAVFVNRTKDWHRYLNFLGPMEMSKEAFLNQLKRYIPADEYIMVGNEPAVFGASDDKGAADKAGWRFIREADFARGTR